MSEVKPLADGAPRAASAPEARGFERRQAWLRELERARGDWLGAASPLGPPASERAPSAREAAPVALAARIEIAPPAVALDSMASQRPAGIADTSRAPNGRSEEMTRRDERGDAPKALAASREGGPPGDEPIAAGRVAPRSPLPVESPGERMAVPAIPHEARALGGPIAPAATNEPTASGTSQGVSKSTRMPDARAHRERVATPAPALAPEALRTLPTSAPAKVAAIETQRIAGAIRAPAASRLAPDSAKSHAVVAAETAEAVDTGSPAQAAAEAAESPASASLRPTHEPPPRRSVHVVAEDGAATVWIRDAELGEARAQGLVSRLAAQLALAGKRLGALAVNGRFIYDTKARAQPREADAFVPRQSDTPVKGR